MSLDSVTATASTRAPSLTGTGPVSVPELRDGTVARMDVQFQRG